jgi:hypothetical protein
VNSITTEVITSRRQVAVALRVRPIPVSPAAQHRGRGDRHRVTDPAHRQSVPASFEDPVLPGIGQCPRRRALVHITSAPVSEHRVDPSPEIAV